MANLEDVIELCNVKKALDYYTANDYNYIKLKERFTEHRIDDTRTSYECTLFDYMLKNTIAYDLCKHWHNLPTDKEFKHLTDDDIEGVVGFVERAYKMYETTDITLIINKIKELLSMIRMDTLKTKTKHMIYEVSKVWSSDVLENKYSQSDKSDGDFGALSEETQWLCIGIIFNGYSELISYISKYHTRTKTEDNRDNNRDILELLNTDRDELIEKLEETAAKLNHARDLRSTPSNGYAFLDELANLAGDKNAAAMIKRLKSPKTK